MQAELKASPAKMQQAVSPRDVSQARDTVASPASVQAKSQEAQRRTAALWIAEVCDCTVPYDTPRAFRAALRDGVLLCQVLNTVMPGALPKVG